jgi:WD40 repeat protein
VELIDASLGRVVKRYSHVENKEEFYCLAWTTLSTLDTWEQEKPYNILAAAGELGTIKLFNPTQSECYRYLFGHSKEVSRLMFSKTKPRWLLST